MPARLGRGRSSKTSKNHPFGWFFVFQGVIMFTMNEQKINYLIISVVVLALVILGFYYKNTLNKEELEVVTNEIDELEVIPLTPEAFLPIGLVLASSKRMALPD